jgi:3-methyladenine DNA glycosylase AlkD
MEQIIEKVRRDLENNAEEKTRISGERYFREQVNMYGVKSAAVKQIARETYKLIQDKGKTNVFHLCGELWKSGYIEESFIACNWSYNLRKRYEKNDFHVFETWLNHYVDNWASCDTLCNHSVGTLVEMYPDLLAGLKKWAVSDNRWTRRGSAVSLIIPARKGMFLREIFDIADILHSDREDMVQKGYGWMLKASSEAHQSEVFDYVQKRKSTMPRTALRYAIEKMPTEMKKQAMSK